jgi:hypothetical protein
MIRKEDLTGTSGTGIVALGKVQDNGQAEVTWIVPAKVADGSLRDIKTTTIYKSWQDCVLLHGHNGRTSIQFDDTGISISDLDVLAVEKLAA